MSMKTIHKRIVLPILLVTLLVAGCADSEEVSDSRKGYVPEGYFSFEPVFQGSKTQKITVRSSANNDELLDKIDNVFVFIFKAADEQNGIQDTDPLEYREYYQYGVAQSIYLRKNETYYVYVVANLDESNIPDNEGSLHTFFNDVSTYGDLKNKYVQFRVLSPADVGKMIMTTDDPLSQGNGIIKIKYNETDEIFAPKVDLYRLQAKFVVNIYNRVGSGVTPTSINAANFPRKSFLVRHGYDYADTNEDGMIGEASFGEFYSSPPLLLPAPTSTDEEYTYGSNTEYATSKYTLQTVEYFCFENRRGSPDLENYVYIPKDNEGKPITDEQGNLIGNLPLVYARNEYAPNCSSHLILLSMTEEDVLRTYIHAGQGRKEEELNPYEDKIANFDVDRNCVYHFNVIINSTKDVIVDSRREFLTQQVLFYLPEDARVDAHYVDMPSYIKGRKAGIAKLQVGTVPESSCVRDANGDVVSFVYDSNRVPVGWDPLPDTNTDENWLRFSWRNPYAPTRNTTAGAGEPTTSKLYVTMRRPEDTNVDGVSSATPILHFNEFVKKENPVPGVYTPGDGVDEYPGGATATNPPSRTAAIRVGFVENATSVAGYESANDDYPFFVPVTQYGLKTIGQLGGWNGELYTSMLGVESIEEHTVRHYAIAGNNLDYNNLGGPWWWYISSLNTGLNHPYNGKQVTQARYDQYRNGVPPVRGEAATAPSGVQNASGRYNPFSQTNAADYCMRKNRDENGDGIISGDEVKWYLPSPAQTMQMYAWRNIFRGGRYTLNDGAGANQITYIPFGPLGSATGSVSSNYYWTTNEVDGTNALVVDFSRDLVTDVVNRSKTLRAAIRCVRDIDGTVGAMFYNSEVGGNTYMVADLENHFPPGFLDNMGRKKPSDDRNTLQGSAYNTIAPNFLISRWYVSNNNNTGASHGNPVADRADTPGNEACGGYSEPGFTSGWIRPSQRELLFIYGYTGLIDNLFEQQYTAPGATTYHKFITTATGNQQPLHWAMSDINSSNTYWWINFGTGAASIAGHKNNSAYRRCIRYLTDAELTNLRGGIIDTNP